MLRASNESNQWVRKFRDYDCYEKMLGADKLHDTVAKTKYGEYVGSCICFEFPEMSFVAIYYVCPKYRGKGVGSRLFADTVTDSLRKGNIGLHAVQAMSPVYEKELGFVKHADWLVDIVKMMNVNVEKINDLKSSLTVKGAREVGLENLVDYDTTVNKSKREPFVRHWAFERNDSVCKVVVDEKDHVIGYGCARLLSVVGYPSLCPIYADNDEAFVALFKALALCYEEELKENSLIDMRTPSTKTPRIKELLSDVAQIEVKSQCVPQFTKYVPDHDINKVYSITDMTLFI
ncbi:unnamed protein product [Toxocara canis]|uniref:N-acetyltransferase domain-containing protein n=1 Tax=Toxocara canis TaxID=6265 RepID=A0A183UWM8_TOXCA|nr:unnamed protein product [Toxocara canis]